MSTPFYDLASLVVVPSGYKASKVYAQKPLTTDGQLTFSRASTATRVNASGLIETVASNVPRLDYLNSSCPRLLLEPQRTNLVTYSEQMDNASWIKLNGSVTANSAVSPDGYTNADSFVPNTTSGLHALRSNNFNQSATAAHSWFVKANGYSKIAVRESDLPTNNYASFNLSTGTLISTSQTGSIVDYGNGWYRCTLVDTNTGASAQTAIFVLPDSYTTGDPLINWSGDGTKGVLAYGAQVELGAYATSYIPTLGAAVTRLADTSSSASIPSLFGATEGSLFIELTHDGTNPNGAIPLFLRSSVSPSFNQATYLQFGNNNIVLNVYSAGSSQAAITGGSYTSGQTLKVAGAYKANDFVLYVNGVQIGTDNSGAISTSLSFVDLGSYLQLQSTFQYNGKISQALLFKTRLTNAQLAELTTL